MFPLNASDDTARSFAETTAQAVILSIITFLSLAGNVLVLLTVYFNYQLHTPTFFFLSSLAVADLLSGVFYTPLYIYSVVQQAWELGETLCRIHAVVISLSFNGSLITLCIVSVDRLIAITDPLRYQLRLTTNKSIIYIALSWVHSFFWAVCPAIGWGEVIFDTATNTCRPNWSSKGSSNKLYVLFLGVVAFLFPVAGTTYSYLKIFLVARRQSRRIKDENTDSYSNANNKPKASDKKAMKTIIIIIGTFIGCWAPYSVLSFSKLFSKGSWVPPAWLSNLALTVVLLNSCLNPVIYSIRDRRFRTSFKKFLCPFITVQRQNGDVDHTLSFRATIGGTGEIS